MEMSRKGGGNVVLKQGVLAGEAVTVAAFASSDKPRPLRLDLLHNKPPTTTTHFSHHQSSIVSESRYTYRQLCQLTKQSKYRLQQNPLIQHTPVAMAGTRSTTGNSKPRVFETVSTEPTRKLTTKKSTKAKANTSKPRAKTGAGVKKTVAKKPAKKTSVKAKVEGAAEKVVGKVEGKPGKVSAGTKKMKGTTTTKPKTTKKVVAKK